ncbi:hypothetical protein MBLNU230_g6961t1 [Neophaeotheca triangularis]
MALDSGQTLRHRSSTAASTGLDRHESEHETAKLIRQLSQLPEESNLPDALDLQHLETTLVSKRGSKDVFRRGGGFQVLLDWIKRFGVSTEQDELRRSLVALRPVFSVLAEAFREHSGNERYFTTRLEGWAVIEESLGHMRSNLQELSSSSETMDEWLATLYSSLLALALGDSTFGLPQLLDEDASDTRMNGKHVVFNPRAIHVLLRLACYNAQYRESTGLDIRISSIAIARIGQTAALSLGNNVALQRVDAMSILLDVFLRDNDPEPLQKAIFSALSIIGKLGLERLESVQALVRKASERDDARRLLLRLSEESKTPSVIQFDLRQHGYSSLELPTLPRTFPPNNAYSLACWIRLDTIDLDCHTTVFGAFDASQTCFVLAYIEKESQQLILQTSVKSARPSVRFKSTRFKQGRWYHVTVVHRKGTSDSRQSPAMLFVNGNFAEQVKCAYPESPPEAQEQQATLSLGSGGTRRVRPVQAFFGTPHDLALRHGRDKVASCWSLGSAQLYQAPLSDEFIAVQHRLGPRYTGNSQDCLGPLLTYRASAELNRYNELLHPDKTDKSDIIAATEGRGSDVVPESRLLLSIIPSAVVSLEDLKQRELPRKALTRIKQLAQNADFVALNAAIPTVSEAIGQSYGAAILTGEPIVAISHALDDATWRLAGSLPALIRILECANTKSAFLESLELFFVCVKDNWRISEAMEKGNGFGILALLIREKLGFELGASTQVLTKKASAPLAPEQRQGLPCELLHLILDFVGYNKEAPEDSIIVNPMAYRVLLIDFDTWRRCDVATQKSYYAQFIHFTTRNKHQAFNCKRLTRMRVVKKLIEALKIEEIDAQVAESIMKAIKSMMDQASTQTLYRDLAIFVAFGLQDERSNAMPAAKNVASVVRLRKRTISWARSAKASRPDTPSGAPLQMSAGLARSDLAVMALELLADLVCDTTSTAAIRRFARSVPNRWMLHVMSESDVKVHSLLLRIISRCLNALGQDFKKPFAEKNGGFTTLRAKLKTLWKSPTIWVASFAILLGNNVPANVAAENFSLFALIEVFAPGDRTVMANSEIMPAVLAMLEAGLRSITRDEQTPEADFHVVKTVMQFLSELYNRSPAFRDLALSSRYLQELLFVLFPLIAGTDRLPAEMELESEKGQLTFKGEEVAMRPHSNSLGERPPSVRSIEIDRSKQTPSPGPRKRVEPPRRLSSFVLVKPDAPRPSHSPAQFTPIMAPKTKEPIKLNVGNSLVESLLELIVSIFLDQICNREKFAGLGLFLKVPPGFKEYQAYFESYVLVHTMQQLWHQLQLDQGLFLETRVLTNLARYSLHMAEAVFEGWFIDGAAPLQEFTGKVLDYLQQPDVASVKSVRLCAQATNTMRTVFLRVTLWRLSELDERVAENETKAFLDNMNYWQTILFSTENQETPFIRLICYLLYHKLVANVRPVRLAAASLWRTVLVQKPTESATLLTYAMGSDRRHLSTGFMKLVSLDDDEFLAWVDENRESLDVIFVDALSKPWDEFVADENRRSEESAKSRLLKRREKLRLWQSEEAAIDRTMQQYEVTTNHWRANVHSQERLKLQASAQDHQESVSHLFTVLSRLDTVSRQPCGMDAESADTKWQLDETEAVNRMRMRTVPDTSAQKAAYQPKRKFSERAVSGGKLALRTQASRELSENIMSPRPNTPVGDGADATVEVSGGGRARAESASNSQLLEGGFEMVDDPREDEDGLVEDKNRKVMTSLQRGDVVQHLYNVSRIVGLEACEGLLVVGKKCLYLQDNYFQRSDGEIVSVGQAPDDERDPYVQLISGKDVGAQRTKHSIGDHATRHWTWTEVLSISKRRFLFRDVSVEVFFTDGRSYLLTSMSAKTRDDLYNGIVSRAPHVHSTATVASEDSWRLDTLRNPEEVPQSLGLKFANVFNNGPSHTATKKWVKGDMSNFQYLMLVNTMAGRTFNDLTQYPVFPWVLADYTSDELDLTDPKSFRDFSKPMGCQNALREAEYRERYKQFAEMGDHNAPPFHYGTHYSSAMIVTSYLIRLQPFVQSYLLLQGGVFDHADRLFDSIESAWLSASKENMTDVRELTPEFFYLPEFLSNVNGYDFGAKQGSGEAINNVHLPKWAKGDPHIFIAKHREALESPYVSERLHQWVDLIFGYKQRGEAAEEATNVFQHLSYHGAKDLDTIQDPVERLATIGIIHNFGQTPHQTFQRPHPAREEAKHKTSRLDTTAESLIRLPSPLFESDEKIAGLTFSPTQERLLCSGPCKLNILPNCDRFLQWGFADNSIRFFSSNTKRLLGLYENTHIGAVSTATFADSKTLVTAGKDCTIGLWNITATRDAIDLQPKTYLFGHRAPVTLLAASRVFSTLLSVSADGQALLWDLNRHDSIRILLPSGGPPVQAAKINNTNGHIALCIANTLNLYTLNGHLLFSQPLPHSVTTTLAFYEGTSNEWLERELVFTGHAHGVVNVWAVTSSPEGAWELLLVKRLNHTDANREDGGNVEAAVTSVLPMGLAVYTGDEEGRVWEWDCVQRGGGRGR